MPSWEGRWHGTVPAGTAAAPGAHQAPAPGGSAGGTGWGTPGCAQTLSWAGGHCPGLVGTAPCWTDRQTDCPEPVGTAPGRWALPRAGQMDRLQFCTLSRQTD